MVINNQAYVLAFLSCKNFSFLMSTTFGKYLNYQTMMYVERMFPSGLTWLWRISYCYQI